MDFLDVSSFIVPWIVLSASFYIAYRLWRLKNDPNMTGLSLPTLFFRITVIMIVVQIVVMIRVTLLAVVPEDTQPIRQVLILCTQSLSFLAMLLIWFEARKL